ncbi:MAG: hypothetical protein AAF530_24105 [Pseudomonadota bacterium]
MIKKIENPKSFFERLGGIHDAQIESIKWDVHCNCLAIKVDDLNSNFLGLPEYEGCRPVNVQFSDVPNCNIDVQSFDKDTSIFDIDIENIGPGFSVHIRLSPGGYLKFRCESISLREP